MNIDLLLDKMWKMYTSYTPSANQISKLFNEEVTNDHIAFRTFNTEHLSINRQAKFLEQYGYYHGGDYDFKVIVTSMIITILFKKFCLSVYTEMLGIESSESYVIICNFFIK